MFTGFIWFNYQVADLGKGGDEFYLQWSSGRRLAYQAQNPYEDQLVYPTVEGFGALKPGTQTLRFNTPIYSLFLVFPFILIEKFQQAFVAWLVFSGLILLALIWGGLSLSNWKSRNPLTVMLVIFISVEFFTIQALGSGSLIIMIGGLFILAFLALQSNRWEFAGFLFALTTVQPHYFFLIYGLLILWGISRRQWNFLLWFIFGIVLLTMIGIFVIPDWPLDYLRTMWRFDENFFTNTISKMLVDFLPGLGKQLGWGLTGMMLVLCVVEWWNVRGKDFRWFAWTACITLVASQWAGIPVDISEYFILMIPVMLIVSIWAQRTGKIGMRLIGISLATFLLIPWLIAFRSGLPNGLVNPGLAQYFLLPFILLIGLYWVRWWAIRPQRLYIEELRSNETA